jgi:hypothetical protein
MSRLEKQIRFDGGSKFDLQLSAALIAERRLGDIFTTGQIEKIELKSESWLWEQSGNIAIEYARDGQPSGISVTEADYWVHELLRDGATVLYLMFPIDRLRDLVTRARLLGHWRKGGDGERTHMALIALADILDVAG